MNVKSRQYSGRSESSSIASLFFLNRAHDASLRPEHTSVVSLRRAEMLKGEVRPSGAMRS